MLVPVKAFDHAKARLAPALTLGERADLARWMATGVVRAAAPLPTWVVCDDRTVARWAREQGAGVSWQPGSGLNRAVADATRERFASGATRVIVVHGDLPLIGSLECLDTASDEVILVPDRHGSGTNVISTPTPEFAFAYGPGSYRRHRGEAARLGLRLEIVRDAEMGWDVDEPDDLVVLQRRRPEWMRPLRPSTDSVSRSTSCR